MVQAQHEVQIEQPADIVFDFLADGANNPRWQPRVVETTRKGPQEGAGTSYRQSVRHPPGFKVSADYRVTEFDRPHRLRFEVTSGGPIRPTGAYELTAVNPGSTRVRSSVQYQPYGPMLLATPLLPIVRTLFGWEASWINDAKQVLESTRD